MTNELRDKIAKVLEGVTYDDSYALPLCLPLREQIADRLIAAGLKFDTVVSHTATFDLMQQEQINSLERRCAQAEHRAARAERALKICSLKIATMIDEEVPACDVCKNYQSCNLTVGACSEYMEKCCVEQAERELAEEGK